MNENNLIKPTLTLQHNPYGIKEFRESDLSTFILEPEEETTLLLKFPSDEKIIEIAEEILSTKIVISSRKGKNVRMLGFPRDSFTGIGCKRKDIFLERIRRETKIYPRVIY
jgi:hypothetical protein